MVLDGVLAAGESVTVDDPPFGRDNWRNLEDEEAEDDVPVGGDTAAVGAGASCFALVLSVRRLNNKSLAECMLAVLTRCYDEFPMLPFLLVRV